ncbi:MAG: GSCFA domain-containing protein [Flavobacterium sp. JAD_PAG50586_2]|nr:MAG: GSCFA domain-containing protein [Flavobacterium sp. JAD_PAG50586_2]
MNFTTKIPIEKSKTPISYDSRIVSLGSCFAENMGEKFSFFKFQNFVNPFGIIFNPVSIEKLLLRIVRNQKFTEDDIFFHNDLWHCFDVHSELSNPDKVELLTSLNGLLESTHNQITKSTHIIITYGTSWVYRNKTSGNIVANCHKVTQNQFDKEILPVETIQKSIKETIDLIRKINPHCCLLFTISPVRHIKDGIVENQLSKAHLITAVHSLSQPYFPSYEIVMDELRDYRFYAEDMLHPSQTAIDYIWERFSESHISEAHHSVIQEVGSIQKAMAHRPFNADSDAHQKFLLNLKGKIEKLQQQFPHFTF